MGAELETTTNEKLKELIDAIEDKLDNPDNFKADVSALALEATLTAIKGAGWSNETLKAIYEAIVTGTYSAVTNRTVGTKTLTIANTEYALLELNGEATNIAYKGRLKIRLPRGYTFVLHKYTKINSDTDAAWKEIGPGIIYNTVASEENDDGYRFEDTETIKYTIECDTAGVAINYECNYASRSE